VNGELYVIQEKTTILTAADAAGDISS